MAWRGRRLFLGARLGASLVRARPHDAAALRTTKPSPQNPRPHSPASLRTLPALTDFGDVPLFDTPALLRAAGGAPGSAGGLFGGAGTGGGALSPCPLSNDAFLRTVHALTGESREGESGLKSVL